MNWHKRLTQAREAKGIKKSAFAKLVGVSAPTVTDWENGDTKMIEGANLIKVCAALAISPEWLLNGIGEPSSNALAISMGAPSNFDRNATPAALGSRAIPIISAIQAGAMREISVPYPVGSGYATVFVDDSYSGWAFGLEIEGDSMLPDFRPGDIVIIEPEWEPRPGECVAAKNGKEEATFKKYRQRGTDAAGNDIFELVPLNEDYPTLRSDETPLKIIGVMAEHRRKSRRR